MKNEEHLIHEEEYLFHEEEFPVYENKRKLLDGSPSSNKEKASLSSDNPSQVQEVSSMKPTPPRRVLTTPSSRNEEDKVKEIETKYKKLLADAKKEFEESIKEYQDKLAAKDLDILMSKVQLESLQQKSEATIDDVIKKTQKHMSNEIAKLKRAHELKVTKLLSESKAYFKQDAISKEKEIARLKKEIETFTSEPRRTQEEQDLEIEKLKDEFVKREEQILLEAKERIEQILEEAKRKEKQIQEEADKKEEQILSEIKPKVEKIISEKQQALLLANQRYDRLKQQGHPSIYFHDIKKAPTPTEELVLQSEQALQKEVELKKEATLEKESSKEKKLSKNAEDDIQKIIYQERKRYKRLEKEVNKLNQVVDQLSLEKKDLNRKLDRVKDVSAPKEEEDHKAKSSLFELIITIVLIVANLVFIFFIYPNITDWIEGFGLNHLSITIRALMTAFVIMISLFCFVKAREISQKKASSKLKKKKGHSVIYLLGIVTIGTILLVVFLVNATFLFFFVGTILIILAGLLLVGYSREL